MKNLKNNVVIKSVVRLLIFIVLFINSILVSKGISPIPFDEAAFMEWVQYGLAAVSGIWVWHKDNPDTTRGLIVNDIKDAIKEHGAEFVLGILNFTDDGKGEDDEL